MQLSDVSISIKTFLRDPYLFNTIEAIQTNLPECKMIITDDGEMTDEKNRIYADLVSVGHVVEVLPFDSGFGKKSNVAAASLKTSHLLTGADDFDFNTYDARDGIIRLVDALDRWSDADIASGRVHNTPYEFKLRDYGHTVVEVPLDIDGMFSRVQDYWCVDCDLTVNYSLIDRRVFDKIRWDDDVKIGGGEHGAFFVDCKRAEVKTIFVPQVNINEQRGLRSPAYRKFRQRGFDSARPCFDRRGIKKYVCGDGTVDYDKTAGGSKVL